MMKIFGRSNGSHWSIYSTKTYFKNGDDFIGFFYLFPTLKISRSDNTYKMDSHEFGIGIAWGFWEFYLSHYRGENCEYILK